MENKQAEVDGFQLSLDLREQLLQKLIRDRDLSILTPLLHKLPVLKDAYVDVHLKLKILHVAAWAGDVDLVRKLMNVEADPTAKTEGGYTALHLAASRGHCHVIVELQSWLGRLISVQEDSSEDGVTSLHLAAFSGDAEAVRLLLEMYEDVENAVKAKDKLFGRNVLHFAIAGGHADVVQVLFDSELPLDLVSKDRARGWTPFLLSAWQRPLFHETMKGYSINFMDMLLEENYRQINDRVGVLAIEFREDRKIPGNVKAAKLARMSKFFIQHLSLLLQNSKDGTLDGSLKQSSINDNEVNENEWDQYQKFKIPIYGHTALHLAATQKNHELVKYLIQLEGIQLNVGEPRFGMTPLHCTIRTGAMEAFKVLISVKEVDVNAKVVAGGECHLSSWLSQNSTSSEKKGRELDFAGNFERLDTPLHLATRMCDASDLPEMLVEFGSHPNFDPATYNLRREVPLHIARERYSYYHHKRSKFLRQKLLCNEEKNLDLFLLSSEEKSLEVFLDMLENHPKNEFIMTASIGRRKAVQDSVNTFLVAATFIAGVTFAAYLQPPFGTNVGDFRSRPARLFWIWNSVSFYFAVYTILRCLMWIIRDERRSDLSWEKTEFLFLIRLQNGFPLTVSVGFGVGAFAAAGFGNLPPDSQLLMLACTISGVALVGFQLLTNLYVFCSQMIDEIPEGKRRDSVFRVCWILGGPLSLVYLWLPENVKNSKKLSNLLFKRYVSYHLLFLVLQAYGLVAVLVYSFIEIF